ncbi:hypothetical protein, partial [Aegicerativicinus sediminis]
MTAKSPKKLKFSWSKWWRHLLVVLSFGVLFIVALFVLGWLNRDLVLKELHQWYSENNKGTLEIGRIDTNFIRAFPNVGFTIREITQSSFDTVSDKKSSVYIDRVNVAIGVGDLLSGSVRFKKIEVKQAELISEVRSSRPFDYHVNLKRLKQSNPTSGISFPSWINTESLIFTIENLNFQTKDTILHKFFDLNIHNVIGNFEEYEDKLRGSANFDITVNALGFNTLKGYYFNGARVKGAPKFQLNNTTNIIEIPDFALHIDDQIFNLKADFDLTDLTEFKFSLNNEETDFQAVKKMLPDSLSVKLEKYVIQKPFKTSLDLNGKFEYGNNPDLYAEFSSVNNEVLLNQTVKMDSVVFNGYLTNNIYESDSLRSIKSSKKDAKIYFENLEADIKDIKLTAHDSYYQSSVDAANYIKADLHVSGSNETLAEVLENDNFAFKGGQFNLEADVDGDISSLPEIFNSSTGKFNMSNTNVSLKKNGLQLPVETVSLTLNHENSTLNELKINLPNGKNLIFSGSLKNASSVLADDPTKQMSSFVTLDSRDLDINDLIITAKEFLPSSQRSIDDRKNLHEILDAIYHKFHPRFKVDLNTVEYNSITLNNLKADLELINPETINLQSFVFDYFEASTKLEGLVRVPKPQGTIKDPIFIDARAETEGQLHIFQDLFNIQLVEIKTGDFKFTGDVKGNIHRFDELLNSANGNLKIEETKFYYPNADLDIAFDSLTVKINDSKIELNNFELEVGEIYPFILSGKVEKFPGFLIDDIKNEGTISMVVDAPYIDVDEWSNAFKSLDEEKEDKSLKKKNLYKAFK